MIVSLLVASDAVSEYTDDAVRLVSDRDVLKSLGILQNVLLDFDGQVVLLLEYTRCIRHDVGEGHDNPVDGHASLIAVVQVEVLGNVVLHHLRHRVSDPTFSVFEHLSLLHEAGEQGVVRHRLIVSIDCYRAVEEAFEELIGVLVALLHKSEFLVSHLILQGIKLDHGVLEQLGGSDG